jgi:hypothetical protein
MKHMKNNALISGKNAYSEGALSWTSVARRVNEDAKNPSLGAGFFCGKKSVKKIPFVTLF